MVGVDGALVGGGSSDPERGVGGNSIRETGVVGWGLSSCVWLVGLLLPSLPHSQNSFLGGGCVGSLGVVAAVGPD